MKNQNLAFAAIAAVGLASGAFAQVFSYHPNDLIIAVRQDSSATTDVEFDLGPVSNLANVTSPYTPITTTSTLTGVGTGVNIASKIIAGVGPTTGKLDIAAFAEGGIASGKLWLSQTREGSDTGVQGTQAIYTVDSKNTQNTTVLAINNIGVAAGQFAGNPVNGHTGLGYIQIPTSNAKSYTAMTISSITSPGTFKNKFGQGSVETLTDGSGWVNFDFFSLDNHANGNTGNDATYLGFFTLTPDARILYTPAGSLVPEPSSYAAAAGFGLLAFAALRRRFSK